MQLVFVMVLRSILRLLGPVIALIDRLIPGVTGKETVLPEEDHVPKPASTDLEIESATADLFLSRTAWAALDSATKADLLRTCKKLCIDNYEAICQDATTHKGSYQGGVGDEMILAAPLLFYFTDFEDLMRNGPRKPVRERKVGDRVVCDVFPRGLDNMLLGGAYAEVWMRPGKDACQGVKYESNKKAVPGVCCILAAGNHICMAVRDVLQQLVVNNNLCVLKINPCNDWIGPAVATILEPLIHAGALRIVYGPAGVAKKLVVDDRVTAVHMTGSTATYNAIVWGPGGPGGGKQLVTKPFEAELGCVTPYIIVPSKKRWSTAELRYHAQMAISSKILNSGHNCNATELIITCASWPQRQEFVDALKWALDSISQRWPWYPGSQERMDAFRERFPSATEHGIGICTMRRCTHPMLFASGLSPSEAQTDTETWGPALQEIAMPVAPASDGTVDVAEFLSAAVAFCNEQCFGTLSCGMAVHPAVCSEHREAVDAAVAGLRYGSVGINLSPAFLVSFPSIPWGAWAAAGTPEDIGSGNVLSHTGVFDNIEKGVLTAPWMMAPKPLVFPTHTNTQAAVARLAKFMDTRGLLALNRLLAANFRSK